MLTRYFPCKKTFDQPFVVAVQFPSRSTNINSNVCLLVGCLTSQQRASVSQGRICSDKFTCCHTETEIADPTFYLTQSQYTDTGPTSPSTDPITPGAWQGSHWRANFEVTGMTRRRNTKSKQREDRANRGCLPTTVSKGKASRVFLCKYGCHTYRN